MNGLDFLEKIMRLRPMPVIMVSTLTSRGADATIRALEIGALDCVASRLPRTPAHVRRPRREGEDGSRQRGRAPLRSACRRACASRSLTTTPRRTIWSPSAASTGGVEALIAILEQYPRTCPPTVITQHMPATFTTSFARAARPACAPAGERGRRRRAALAGPRLPGARRRGAPRGRRARRRLRCRLRMGDPVERPSPFGGRAVQFRRQDLRRRRAGRDPHRHGPRRRCGPARHAARGRPDAWPGRGDAAWFTACPRSPSSSAPSRSRFPSTRSGPRSCRPDRRNPKRKSAMSIKDQLKILVVDDTSVSRALIIDGLQTIGLKGISIAKDGAQALQAMMTSPSHLVISDLNMPKSRRHRSAQGAEGAQADQQGRVHPRDRQERQGDHRPCAPVRPEQLPGQAVHRAGPQGNDRSGGGKAVGP